jgi:hypothetical protein
MSLATIRIEDAMTIASEIANGEGIYLAEAARLFPAHRQGRPVSPSCVFRWATTGVRLDDGSRAVLETVRLAGKLLTSKAAIERFLSAQTPRIENTLVSPRTPTRRQREHGRAKEALAEKYGI